MEAYQSQSGLSSSMVQGNLQLTVVLKSGSYGWTTMVWTRQWTMLRRHRWPLDVRM